MSKKFQLLIIIIFIAGIGLRFVSFSWNTIVHGDVGQYVVAAEAFAHGGNFLIDTATDKPHFYSLQMTGGRFLEHNPLWPFIGGIFIKISGFDGYTALKVLSLLSGTAVLYLVFLLGCRLGGDRVAVLSLFFTAFSYLLIDYSGNGAFYIFQALLYLIFVLLITDTGRSREQIALGAVMGIGILLNQQTLVLIAAYIAYRLITMRGSYRAAIRAIIFGIAILILFYLPWGIRNYMLFGTPFSMVDTAYVWSKLGADRIVENNIISFRITWRTYGILLWREITFWFPHNLYFLNRQFFVLAPVVYMAALFAVASILFKDMREKLKPLLSLILVLGFHLALSSAWPIAKFRYIVPVLPLVFILGSYYMIHMIPGTRLRRLALVTSMVGIVVVSLLTYVSTPTHTYYYGASITTDNFGKSGEVEFLKSLNNPEE